LRRVKLLYVVIIVVPWDTSRKTALLKEKGKEIGKNYPGVRYPRWKSAHSQKIKNGKKLRRREMSTKCEGRQRLPPQLTGKCCQQERGINKYGAGCPNDSSGNRRETQKSNYRHGILRVDNQARSIARKDRGHKSVTSWRNRRGTRRGRTAKLTPCDSRIEVLSHVFNQPLPTEAAGLLGTDFLVRNGVIVDLDGDKLVLPEMAKTSERSGETSTKHAALTIFLNSKEGRSPQLSAEVGRQRKVTSPPESSSTLDNSWIVKAAENVELAPRCRQVVPAKLELGKKKLARTNMC
jgi:hypothetical protein